MTNKQLAHELKEFFARIDERNDADDLIGWQAVAGDITQFFTDKANRATILAALRTDDRTTEPVQTDEVREVVERVDQFSIQERDDDMLIGERHWQFGWRCIARRPKMMTNAEWRPEAERIVAALERLSLPTEPSEDVERKAKQIGDSRGDPNWWRYVDEARAALRTITPDRIRGEAWEAQLAETQRAWNDRDGWKRRALGAFEEAAKVAEEQYGSDTGWHSFYRQAGFNIATAIRALKAPSKETDAC